MKFGSCNDCCGFFPFPQCLGPRCFFLFIITLLIFSLLIILFTTITLRTSRTFCNNHIHPLEDIQEELRKICLLYSNWCIVNMTYTLVHNAFQSNNSLPNFLLLVRHDFLIHTSFSTLLLLLFCPFFLSVYILSNIWSTSHRVLSQLFIVFHDISPKTMKKSPGFPNC